MSLFLPQRRIGSAYSNSMRSTKILSVTLPTDMLEDAKRLAKEEDLTMSELVREALKLYPRQKRPDSVSKLGRYSEE